MGTGETNLIELAALALAAGVSLSYNLRNLLADRDPVQARRDDLERGLGLLTGVAGVTQLLGIAAFIAVSPGATLAAPRFEDGLIAMFCAALLAVVLPTVSRATLHLHERLLASGSLLVALCCVGLTLLEVGALVPPTASRLAVDALLVLSTTLALRTVRHVLGSSEQPVLRTALLMIGLSAILEILLMVANSDHHHLVTLALALTAPAGTSITRRRLDAVLEERSRQLEQVTELTTRLDRVIAEAEHAKASRARFVANVTHELRTPLHGIIGLSSLLNDTRLDSRQREMLTHLVQSGKALRSLIDDVIDFSRIDAGKTEIRPDWVDLRSTVGDVLATLAHSAHGKGLGLEARFGTDVPAHVHLDALRFRQILLNLCSNAVKFTQRGDVRVLLRVRRVQPELGWLECDVRDTGVGISADKLPHLFDPFFQGDTSDTREFGGSGLGLAISRDLAISMGGQLDVESTPGEGSCFRLRLPVPVREEPEIWRLPIQAGTRVLVLDWDGLLRYSVEPMLEASRAIITWKQSVNEVRENECFDLILDGALALPQRVAELRNTCGARWIACMALDDRVEWQRGATPNAVVYRPIVPSRLADVLRDAPTPDLPQANREDPERLEVMVVDDNPVNLLVACRIVEALGHGYTAARDGAEALSMLEKTRPDIILMDCQMPGIDGFEATRRIRARFGGQHRILALTAATFEHDRIRAREAGMDGFIHKPVDMDQLREAMHRTMLPTEERWVTQV